MAKETILVKILSNMALLIFPMTDFDGFIDLHNILSGGIWGHLG